MPLWLSLYLVKRPLQISLSTLLQTGCFPKPVEPIIKGLVFQKGTCDSQSKKIPAIFAKVGDVTPDNSIMLRIQTSLSPVPPWVQGVEMCDISD